MNRARLVSAITAYQAEMDDEFTQIYNELDEQGRFDTFVLACVWIAELATHLEDELDMQPGSILQAERQ
jgi:hypothetical protein